ncbi:Protein TIC 21, chloroplastic [Linum perenne]
MICIVVAAVIFSFSIVATGKITSPVSFYTTSGGIVAAFILVFWSFGCIRLSERLWKTTNDPSKLLKSLPLLAKWKKAEMQLEFQHYRRGRAREGKMGSNWLDWWMEESLWTNHAVSSPRKNHRTCDDDKILEVDTWKPHMKNHHRTFQTPQQYLLASSDNVYGLTPFDSPSKSSTRLMNVVSSREALPPSSALSRPVSSGRKGGNPFTPTRSETSWGYFNGYSSYPNYMANTESSIARFRSQSVPRQRVEYDKLGSSKRSLKGVYDSSDMVSECGFGQHTELRNKAAYNGSGRLGRVGSTRLSS